MKARYGCLGMVLTMIAGYAVGFYINDRFVPFISREEAISDGLWIARKHCRELEVPFPIRCGKMRLTRISEDETEWFMDFASDDNLYRDSMLIRRRGSYDATGLEIIDPRTGDEFIPGSRRAP